jgi:hypothetical protein
VKLSRSENLLSELIAGPRARCLAEPLGGAEMKGVSMHRLRSSVTLSVQNHFGPISI